MNANIDPVSADSGSSQIFNDSTELLAKLYGKELEPIYVERVVVGIFCTGVKLSSGHGGIAYTPPEAIQRAGNQILKGPKALIRGLRAGELISHGTPGPFSDVIRLAALNALSVPFLIRNHSISDGDVTDYTQFFTGKKICMMGAIVPTLKRLQACGIHNVTIIDNKETTGTEPGFGNYIPMEKADEALAACETAIFAGASIANGAIEHLIRRTSPNAAIIVVGPTAGFVPEPLFQRRVAMIGTVVVTDSDLALDLLSEGAAAYQLFRRCLRKIVLINPERVSALT
jgi:uncharacterized protein